VDFNKFSNQAQSSQKQGEGFYCYKPWQLLIIRYNGDVVPCGMPFRHYDLKDYLLGNLYVNSIGECWNSPKINKIRELHLKRKYNKIPFCRDCVSAYTNIT